MPAFKGWVWAVFVWLSPYAMAQSSWQALATVSVEAPDVRLFDLFDPATAEDLPAILAQVRIATAPRLGERKVVSQAQVWQVIHRVSGYQYDHRIRLPNVIQVTRGGKVIQDELVWQSAIDGLQAQLASRCVDGLSLLRGTPDDLPPLPQGVMLKTRDVTVSALGRRTQVWVDVYEQGQLYRSVPLWFEIGCRAPVRVAAQVLTAGSGLTPQNFVWQSMDVGRLMVKLPDEAMIQRSELKQDMVAGQVLTVSMLRLRPLVRRQTAVVLVVSDGSVQVTLPATALADGQLGDEILTTTSFGTGRPIRARVMGVGQLEVVERQ